MSPKKRSKGSILAGVRARSASAPNVAANQNAIIGRVWYSLSGRFQRAFFQSLVDALLTNVVNHPGVSLVRISFFSGKGFANHSNFRFFRTACVSVSPRC